MIYLAHLLKLNGLLTLELFVLTCSLFLLAYVSKQQLSKWYRYGAGAIAGIMVLILICTTFYAFHACGGQSCKRSGSHYSQCAAYGGCHGKAAACGYDGCSYKGKKSCHGKADCQHGKAKACSHAGKDKYHGKHHKVKKEKEVEVVDTTASEE